jgi:hypothetical protein
MDNVCANFNEEVMRDFVKELHRAVAVQGEVQSPAEVAARLVGLAHRLAWCAIQRRVWLREARRTGRRLVVRRPCTDPLKSRDECCKYSEYHSDSENH